MILPTKRIRSDHSLIGIGSDILGLIGDGATVSGLWNGLQGLWQEERRGEFSITSEWFILAIDLLYMLGAIELKNGIIRRRSE